MTEPLFRLGQHEAKLDALTDRVENIEHVMVSMDGKMDTVLSALAERRGERRVAGWLGGTVAGAAVSFAVTYLRAKFGGHP